ncbi:hypothetical protein [Anaerococcus tetradius]|uniref:MORN repeat protein n=1 Tax=Anaerococcus tetradius ATCC 35098 TaxID=525255 RepID=C2CIL6_9FIRM|nr:hypothetical protein [Anaerococcus tetradius]EEI82612.1 hypothetical protein HMPREF0077_1365 [Anaerococcus tetradius ATCC 35098]
MIMDYKKFLSYFAKLCLGIFIIGGLYTILKPKTKNVTDYKLADGLLYTGKLYRGKFQGKGVLKTKEGLYKGDFKKGRLVGEGVYIGDSYYYIKDKKEVKIKYNDGRVYKKVNGKWEEEKNAN